MKVGKADAKTVSGASQGAVAGPNVHINPKALQRQTVVQIRENEGEALAAVGGVGDGEVAARVATDRRTGAARPDLPVWVTGAGVAVRANN